MAQFNGKWEIECSENFGDYMTAIGMLLFHLLFSCNKVLKISFEQVKNASLEFLFRISRDSQVIQMML